MAEHAEGRARRTDTWIIAVATILMIGAYHRSGLSQIDVSIGTIGIAILAAAPMGGYMLYSCGDKKYTRLVTGLIASALALVMLGGAVRWLLGILA